MPATLQPVHRGNQHHQANCANRKTAAQATHPDVKHLGLGRRAILLSESMWSNIGGVKADTISSASWPQKPDVKAALVAPKQCCGSCDKANSAEHAGLSAASTSLIEQ
jgi:hypothetical protein